MLWNILKHGYKKKKDDSEIIEIVNNHFFIDPPYSENQFVKMTPELFQKMLDKGKFNITNYLLSDDALKQYVLSLDDPEMIYFNNYGENISTNNDFIYTYPERLLSYATTDSIAEDAKQYFENQMQLMANRLLENEHSNRAIAVLYIPGVDAYREDIPCLNWMQALIHDDCLTLHIMFRSNDIYQAFPANMLFLMYFGVRLVDILQQKYENLRFGGIYYNSTSAHIYETNYKQVENMEGINDYRGK